MANNRRPLHIIVKENRLHRTRHVLARAGLVGVLPDHPSANTHREKYKENVKTTSISRWNLSNDLEYDASNEHDGVSKRQLQAAQVCPYHWIISIGMCSVRVES